WNEREDLWPAAVESARWIKGERPLMFLPWSVEVGMHYYRADLFKAANQKPPETFDDLIAIGLKCFNPFQPEVMDVDGILRAYRGRLSFWGGLSTQRTLPYGSVEDVRRETRHLLEMGREGSFILSPAHAVEGDVPLENMLAFIETAQQQTSLAA
ncbi:MAG: hypothetical protein LAP13_20935, partial [Acidobacteriia bacterium]|nr:hypothetical protein [Terriglobia bacterium]